MTSYIVSSTDKKKREAYISGFCLELQVDKFDITYSDSEGSKNQNSIGINDIKSIHQKIFLKPINSESKVIIIDDAHLLTIEAQNALLKALEEPPDHTIIILSTDKKDVFLPTIISRCHIVELTTETLFPTSEEIPQFSDFINRMQTMPIGEKLKAAEVYGSDKDKAAEWVSKLILVLRANLLNIYSLSELVDLPAGRQGSNNLTMQQFNNRAIKSFQELHKVLKTTNVSPRFAIENTLLSI